VWCVSYSRWILSVIHGAVIMKPLIIVQIVFSIFVTSFAQNDYQSSSYRTAPNFNLENLDGEIIELNSFLGKGPLLLCFWSSCCRSAVAQVEAFSNLYGKYEDEGLMMLAIAVDQENTVAKVKPFVLSKGFKFPVLYDSDRNVSRLYYAYDVPFSVLIDTLGIIVYSHLGYMKGDEIELEQKLIYLINKK
jgi:cytochrome c biogenesis protein CcmG, thiol:disulfide interchange protein DsbE